MKVNGIKILADIVLLFLKSMRLKRLDWGP